VRPRGAAVPALAGILAAGAVAASEPPATPGARETVRIQLLGVNDFHGHLEPPPPIERDGRPAAVGGAAWLASHLDRAGARHPGRTIRVHAGDMVGASPLISAHFHDEPTVEAMNLMRFDVGTVGNHEFDDGGPELLRLIRGGPRRGGDPAFAGARFPYVAANTLDRRGRLLLPPYAIIRRAGVRVGFIGVTTESTPRFLVARHARRFRFLDISDTVNRYVPELRRRGVEAIVVLAHSGGFHAHGDAGRAAGEIIEEAGEMSDAVDVVIAGHTHSFLDARVPNSSGDGHKLVVEALSYGTAYDRVDLTIDRGSGEVVAKEAEIPRTWHRGVPPEARVAALVRRYAARGAPLAGRVVGRTGRAWSRSPGSGDLAQLAADAQRALARTDLAFADPGALRADLAAGEVTYGELFEVAPFERRVLRLRMKGAALQALLDQQKALPPALRLRVSGLDAAAPVHPRRTYTVAADELIATQPRFPLLRDHARRAARVGTDLEALVRRLGGTIP
jgi:5'-nucleotidase